MSNALPVGGTSSQDSEFQDRSSNRAASNARLASPVPSVSAGPSRTISTDAGRVSGTDTPLAGEAAAGREDERPHASALASALSSSAAKSNYIPPAKLPEPSASFQVDSNHGSFDPASGPLPSFRSSPKPHEDFEVVRRHLAGPGDASATQDDVNQTDDSRSEVRQVDSQATSNGAQDPSADDGGFSSLRMQGGDITREIYRRTEAEEAARGRKFLRSNSVSALPTTEPQDEELDYESIRQPGGFRRYHLRQNASSPKPGASRAVPTRPAFAPQQQPSFLARNFYEFLSLYGHFAGEEWEDEEASSEPSSRPSSRIRHATGPSRDEQEEGAGEESPLLKRHGSKRKRRDEHGPKKGVTGTVLILLKSFVGTGVLFLPRAFLNGGMLFSFVVLLAVASLSYYCFLLLTTSRLKLGGSFADMGEMMYGKPMRTLINASLVISQVGFSSAYIVFTSENLRAFILAVSDCKTSIDIKLMILMQLIVFLPLSLYRNLNNISIVVYIADIFIVLGLIYLYYYGISTLVEQGGVADIALFNSNGWTLFIGTAIFTFEGVGLIVPIQDGMKKPQQLPVVLGGVMVLITSIFISMGALAYAAYGSKTETVIILNMRQDNKFVNGLQFIYSLAILLSTPMQIFPAITIMEKGIFSTSGKFSKGIKWRKNAFRFAVVMLSALIAWVGANDLDKFVALVGSFACIPLVYMYPPLIHLRAVARARWSRTIDLAFCFFGFILMAYTSVLTIMSWAKGGEASPPGYCDRR